MRHRAQLVRFDLCRFCEKISFGENLTSISMFVFKLDIFKNNVRETRWVVSWYNLRVGQRVIVFTLGSLDQIESLGHGKRFRT
jgi:hypothetical protein